MFSNFIAKTKESFSKKKIPLAQLIGMVGKIPGVGKAMVREAAKRSSQRHKCSQCGVITEVIVSHIIEDPQALLSDDGKQRLFKEDAPAAETAPTDSTEQADKEELMDDEAVKALEHTIKSELDSCDDRTRTNNEGSDGTDLLTLAQADESATTAATDTTAEVRDSSLASDTTCSTATTGATTANPFACTQCEGRLGVHCFPGDATNGNKKELMAKLFALFDAMPELIALKLPPSKVKSIQEEDIFWVD
jgi:hypothetical protein